eukprot:COSAG02_NODE_18909_length_911_cov_0.881773_1_plen_202_part_01
MCVCAATCEDDGCVHIAFSSPRDLEDAALMAAAEAAARGCDRYVGADCARRSGRGKRKSAVTTSRLLLEWNSMTSLSELDGAMRTLVTEREGKKQRTADTASQRRVVAAYPAALAPPGNPRRVEAGSNAEENAGGAPTAAPAAPVQTPAPVPASELAPRSRPSVAATLLEMAERQNCTASVVQEAAWYILEHGLGACAASVA